MLVRCTIQQCIVRPIVITIIITSTAPLPSVGPLHPHQQQQPIQQQLKPHQQQQQPTLTLLQPKLHTPVQLLLLVGFVGFGWRSVDDCLQ